MPFWLSYQSGSQRVRFVYRTPGALAGQYNFALEPCLALWLGVVVRAWSQRKPSIVSVLALYPKNNLYVKTPAAKLCGFTLTVRVI
jgi:hypothetical protein